MITLQRTDSDNKDFQALVVLLDADLKVRDGEDNAFYAQFNKIDSLRNCVVCYLDAQPVGCGAFKPYGESSVEIKRMYTLPDFRGRGLAHILLQELEQWAKELSYKSCVLETGKMQPEAIALYTKAEYEIIPNYGQYAGVENSVCFQKQI